MEKKYLAGKQSAPNQKLREERERRGWTHKYIAEQIGLGDNHTVSRWERGKSFPNAYYRRKLSELFGKGLEELGLVKTRKPRAALQSPLAQNKQADRSLSTIPRFVTQFIGREQEIAEICALLALPTVQLISLIGAGGSGKTRLAMLIAAQMAGNFSDGVYFISLASIGNPAQVIQAISDGLAIQEKERLSLADQVELFLREKNLLLLLDNFEQVVGAAPFIETLINACPRLKIVVTSREVLHLQTGNDFPVSPLPLPDLAHLPEAETLVHYASVALFMHCAQTRLPSFQITHKNAQTIAELCVRLDGLPLAIELAASRIRSLPPHELLARLAQRLHILKSDAYQVAERHRTLHKTIKWSYDLLSPQDQEFFRQLAVFAGGASLATIENFFGTGELPLADVVDRISSLVDKSLLYTTHLENGDLRVMMLETIRDFGLECLSMSSELEKMHHSHAIYYLHVIEKAAFYLKGAQQEKWLKKIEKEQTDLRAALSWLIEQRETVLALRFCEAFGKFCGLRGYWSEEQRWLKAVLELPQTPESKAIRTRVLRRAGHLAYRLRQLEYARALQEESVSNSRELADKQNLAGALGGLGRVLYRQGEIAAAGQLLQESVAIARESGDIWALANALESLGRFMHDQGKLCEASACLEESVTLSRSIMDKETMVRILTTLVAMELAQEHVSQATALAQEGFELAQELGTRPLIALALDSLGDVALFKGEHEQAKRYFKESIVIARELGDKPAMANRQLKLVHIALFQEDTQIIHEFIQENQKLFRASDNLPDLTVILARCHKYMEQKKGNAL